MTRIRSMAACARTEPRPCRLILVFALGSFLALTLAAGVQAKTTWAGFRPKKAAGRTCVHVGGKDTRYYKLDDKAPLEFTLHGPSRLRLLTRHLPQEGVTQQRSYTLRVMRNGKEVLKKQIIAKASGTATVCGEVGQAVGVGQNSYVTVPKGKQVFRIYVLEEDNPVAVRLFKEKKKSGKTVYVSFTPDSYDRVCTLVLSNGKEYPHYHFSRTHPLRFEVHGPTELRVWSRADFDHTMMGLNAYGLEVLRNGESFRVFHFDDVRKLSSASYKEEECREILPGERKRFDLKVPDGTWTYELRPTELGMDAIAARILIPKKDLSNGRAKKR